VAAFVDLRAAFDSVDKRLLGRCLKEAGVSERLGKRIMEIYEKTRSVVRVGGKMRKEILDSERGETGMSTDKETSQTQKF
jgi:hypothetical protein